METSWVPSTKRGVKCPVGVPGIFTFTLFLLGIIRCSSSAHSFSPGRTCSPVVSSPMKYKMIFSVKIPLSRILWRSWSFYVLSCCRRIHLLLSLILQPRPRLLLGLALLARYEAHLHLTGRALGTVQEKMPIKIHPALKGTSNLYSIVVYVKPWRLHMIVDSHTQLLLLLFFNQPTIVLFICNTTIFLFCFFFGVCDYLC